MWQNNGHCMKYSLFHLQIKLKEHGVETHFKKADNKHIWLFTVGLN